MLLLLMSEWIIVRDKKPEIPGWLPHRSKRIAKDQHERDIYLAFKIGEEISEFQDAVKNNDKAAALEELADVYEIAVVLLHWNWDLFCHHYPVLQDGIDLYGFALRDIVDIADKKRFTHGSFTKGLLLDVCTVDR